MCFPTFPRFCGQTFAEGKDKDLGAGLRAGLQRLDGRGVVRRLRRPTDPALPHPAVGRGRSRPPRCAATPRAACGPWLQRDPVPPRPAHHPHRLLGSLLRGVRRDRHRRVHAHRLVVTMPATSPDAPPSVTATLGFGNAMASMVDFLLSGVLVRFPKLKLALRREPDRLDALRARARSTTCGRTTRAGRRPSTSPSRRPPTTTGTSSAASSTTRTGSTSLDEIGVDNVTLRDRLPATATRRGPTPRPWRRLLDGLTDDEVHRILRSNAIELFALEGMT